jgi:hypothetical protein
MFTAAASSVPVFNDVFYEIHSTRLQNFSISLSWYPFDLSQPWPAS